MDAGSSVDPGDTEDDVLFGRRYSPGEPLPNGRIFRAETHTFWISDDSATSVVECKCGWRQEGAATEADAIAAGSGHLDFMRDDQTLVDDGPDDWVFAEDPS